MALTDIWTIEPTLFFIFSYYPTNGIDEEPTYNSNLLQTYNDAETAAKVYITDQGNEGVCIIQPITCTVVYPAKAWEPW